MNAKFTKVFLSGGDLVLDDTDSEVRLQGSRQDLLTVVEQMHAVLAENPHPPSDGEQLRLF